MKSLKILVIDDGSMRLVLAALLNTMGHRAISAPSAVEGMRIFFQEGDFDLVITDYRMPDKNGDWVVDKIKQSSSSTKTILMSSVPSEAAPRAKVVGADEYLDKGAIGIPEMKKLLDRLFSSFPTESLPAQTARP